MACSCPPGNAFTNYHKIRKFFQAFPQDPGFPVNVMCIPQQHVLSDIPAWLAIKIDGRGSGDAREDLS